MSISVHPEVWQKFPGMRILCVSGHLDNSREYPSVQAALAHAQDSINPATLEHPHLQAWRAAYLEAGISMSKYPCSIQAMVKRIAKGGRVPSINPLVDFYNSISLSNITPLGGLDLDQLSGNQQLRLTSAGEQFCSIGSDTAEPTLAGEVCYSDDTHIITRHFCWRQADKGAIRPDTTHFMLISEIIQQQPEELLEKVREAILEGLNKHFGITGESTVVQA